MMNRYMYFFRLPLELVSVFRIAGRDDDSAVLQDGEGRFVLPGTSIAGAIKSFWMEEFPNDCPKLAGNEERHSRVYVYDAVCRNVQCEKRVGVKIDGHYGVVSKNHLFTQYYIGHGMQCDLALQVSADESERETVVKMMSSLVNAINIGRVRFGAKKVNGAGIFRVLKVQYRVLDLCEGKDLREYLDTDIPEQFNRCDRELKLSDESVNSDETKWMRFLLTVDIPDGLLVRSGEKEQKKDSGSVAVGMSKTVGGEDRYYIPASTVKGLIRAQAERIAGVVGIGEVTLKRIFGDKGTSEEESMAGAVYADDCLIDNAVETVYHRLKIDRLTGAGVNGALVNEKVVSTGLKSNTVIRVSVDRERLKSRERVDSDRLWRIANAMVFLTLREMGTKRLSVGSGASVGYGYLEGSTLEINEHICKFERERQTIDVGGAEELVRGWISELEVPDETD